MSQSAAQYRNRETKDYVFFLTSEFSQWYPSDFADETGRRFHCCEQYMMYHKALTFADIETADKVLAAATPAECKTLGREVKNFKWAKWETVARDIVYRANTFKFTQNPILWDVLAATKGKQLVEAAHYDPVWGIGLSAADPRSNDPSQWQGTNWLGQTLTRLRDDLIAQGFEPKRTAEAMRQFRFYDSAGQRTIYVTQAELCAHLGVKTPYEAVKRLEMVSARDGDFDALHFDRFGKMLSVTVNDFTDVNRELIALITLEQEEPETVAAFSRRDPLHVKKYGR
jgi:ribA/ribD-fused uncharacterized protein